MSSCSRFPGVYTDVSYYTTWILDTIAEAEQEEAYSKQPVRYILTHTLARFTYIYYSGKDYGTTCIIRT